MTRSTLTLDVDAHVARVRFCRPDALNTMTRGFWREIREIFEEIDSRPEVRAVVIESTGKHFTAGIDLNDFGGVMMTASQGEAGRARERVRRLVLEMQESFNVIERCRVPVLAAIQGGCIGGGVDLISACDVRYCTTDAYFRIQEINIGITADVGTLQRLPHLMPAGLVHELAYTGRKLHADRALAAGLVNEVHEGHDALLDAVLGVAAEIASKSPMAIVGSKRMLLHARDHSVADGLDYVATWQAGMLLNDDVMKQMQANMSRQKADFADLLAAMSLEG